MSEYLEEAVWRENYRDLVAGVRMIREMAEELFGPIAPFRNPERLGSSIEDCDDIAQAMVVFAETMRGQIAELEAKIALTHRIEIKGVTEDAPSIAAL
jgi:hypothetical protein